MKKIYIFFFIATTIIVYTPIQTMMSRTSQIAKQKVFRKIQPQKRSIQTRTQIPSIIKKTPTVATPQKAWLSKGNLYWTTLKNKILETIGSPIKSDVTKITQQPRTIIAPKEILSTNEQINAIQTLSEAETVLKNTTEKEFNALKTIANISDTQWTDLITREQHAINYIQQNCFTKAHPNAKWDTHLPEELNKKITFFLNNENINSESISVYYRDTIDIDPFNHDTISVIGPTILYKSDIQTGTKNIIGYEPATITLHKQNIAHLTENQFEAKLQHAITHIQQAHNEKLALLQETIGSEKFAQYAQPYKQALEREADFLEPIKNAQIAKDVQRAFLDEAFYATLENTKKYQSLSIESKTSKIPDCEFGLGIKLLSRIGSLEDLNDYLDNYEQQIYTTLATTSGIIHHNKIDNFIKTINQDKNFILTQCYQKPLKNIIQNPELPLNEIRQLLKQAHINPDSVNIFTTSFNKVEKEKFIKLSQETNFNSDRWLNIIEKDVTEKTGNASAANPTLIKNYKNEIIGYVPAYLCFDSNALIQLSHAEKLYIIAHEISHLVSCDKLIRDNIDKLTTEPQVYTPEIIDMLRIENAKKEIARINLYHLQEIKADIMFAQKDPNFANQISQSFAQKFMQPKQSLIQKFFGLSKPQSMMQQLYIFSPDNTNPFKASETHPDFITRYHWISKINQLHEKEESANKILSQPLFTPEKE